MAAKEGLRFGVVFILARVKRIVAMDKSAKDLFDSLKELCGIAGIDYIKYLGEVEAILRNRIRKLLTPTEAWFKEGKSFNRYWHYLENVTGRKWEYADVETWYNLLRGPSDLREEIPAALRFRVLERDKSTCQKCGRRAPKVELEVDHKLPWAWGGPTVIDNLHTLCQDCNRGKSDTFAEGSS
ncbi:MAG TPA: HNH endonuclease signature motif containing protein [Chloroflexia bacterium]